MFLEPWSGSSVGWNIHPCTKSWQVWSWVRVTGLAWKGGNQLIFLTSMFLSLSLSPSLSLSLPPYPPSSFSKFSKHILKWGFDLKNKNKNVLRFLASTFSFQCLELLECLGIPWVQAAGEAEAMCAHLNAHGYVDGCLTNDGDAFLYGAQTVYKNFTMNTKVFFFLFVSFWFTN